MTLRRIGPFSCAKISGLLYAIIGFIVGVFISFFSLLLGSVGNLGGEASMFTGLFGVGSIIFLPIFYGVLGFVGGAVMAWVFNLVVGWVGGLDLEFDSERISTPSM